MKINFLIFGLILLLVCNFAIMYNSTQLSDFCQQIKNCVECNANFWCHFCPDHLCYLNQKGCKNITRCE